MKFRQFEATLTEVMTRKPWFNTGFTSIDYLDCHRAFCGTYYKSFSSQELF